MTPISEPHPRDQPQLWRPFDWPIVKAVALPPLSPPPYPSGVNRGQAPLSLMSSSASGLPGSKVMETERARMKPSRP